MGNRKLEKYLVSEIADEFNPDYMFQTMYTKLVVDIAAGKIDAKLYAKKELSNRGIGKSGRWVGFEQATKEWGLKWKYD